jgi:hypothetical protein
VRRVADWATISSLATAGGTFILALATFASVRSANRVARTAERSLLAGLLPLLVPTREDDPVEHVGFQDYRTLEVPGGHGAAAASDEAIYLAMSVRNVGSGIAVLHSWFLFPRRVVGDTDHKPVEKFHRLSRDIYLAPGSAGFWQGALRAPETDEFAVVRAAIEDRQPLTLDVLYVDHEGGQRTISRFGWAPTDDGHWTIAVARHWTLDRPGPR